MSTCVGHLLTRGYNVLRNSSRQQWNVFKLNILFSRGGLKELQHRVNRYLMTGVISNGTMESNRHQHALSLWAAVLGLKNKTAQANTNKHPIDPVSAFDCRP